MAKFQSPLLGYNNNVRHKNRVFHIQTEDSGVNYPHIITHLFMDGGRILKSVKTSYAEHLGTDTMNEVVRGLMKEQHKAMFVALRDGQFDSLVDSGSPASSRRGVSAPPSSTGPPKDPTPPPSDKELPPELPPTAIAEAKQVAELPRGAAGPARAKSTADEMQPPTRQLWAVRADVAVANVPAPSGRELTLDFDALEQAEDDAVLVPSLFHAAYLPPPPKNSFTAREAGTGGQYHAVEADTRRDLRTDLDGGTSSHDDDLRHAPSKRPSKSPPNRASNRPPTTRPPSNRPSKLPEGVSADHIPPHRIPAESRLAQTPRAALLGKRERTARPPTRDELVSDKSLDEVILSYLAEDLEAPQK